MKDPKRRFGQVTRMRSGRFQARYSDPNGATTVTKGGRTAPVLHTAPRTFLTRRDAEDWLTQQRRLIRSGEWRSPVEQAAEAEALETSRRNRTFEAYATAWLEARHDLRATTRQSYETSLRKHLIPAFGGQPIDQITVADVRAWFATYGQRTPAARAHAYQVLGAIMRQAEDDELIPRSPVRIKAGGRAKVSREAQVLSRAELLALADAMPPQHRALTLICGMCGLRFGEAVALRLKDVDLEARQLHINRAAYRAGGTKGTGPPKTAAGKRSVTMPTSVAAALAQHLKDFPVSSRDALLFPGRDGKLLAPTSLYGRAARTEKRGRRTYTKGAYGFFAARESIGRPDLHWHDLRRTAATLGAQAGATVREMQHRLGHATGDMALYYQSATVERDRAIADALDAEESEPPTDQS